MEQGKVCKKIRKDMGVYAGKVAKNQQEGLEEKCQGNKQLCMRHN